MKARRLEDLETLVERAQSIPAAQVVTLAQVRGTLLNLLGTARVLTAAVGCFGLLIAVGGVLNTVLASVFERLRELAILKALGASGARLFLVVALEALLISLLGSGTGLLLAFTSSRAVEAALRRVLPYVPSGPVLVIGWDSLWQFAVAGVALGVLACIAPAWKAARCRPAVAMRTHE